MSNPQPFLLHGQTCPSSLLYLPLLYCSYGARARAERELCGVSSLPTPHSSPREAVRAEQGRGHLSKLTQSAPCLAETKARLWALAANCPDGMTDHRAAEFRIFF